MFIFIRFKNSFFWEASQAQQQPRPPKPRPSDTPLPTRSGGNRELRDFFCPPIEHIQPGKPPVSEVAKEVQSYRQNTKSVYDTIETELIARSHTSVPLLFLKADGPPRPSEYYFKTPTKETPTNVRKGRLGALGALRPNVSKTTLDKIFAHPGGVKVKAHGTDDVKTLFDIIALGVVWTRWTGSLAKGSKDFAKGSFFIILKQKPKEEYKITHDEHQYYLVPDEKKEQLMQALTEAKNDQLISQRDFEESSGKIKTYTEYLEILNRSHTGID